jgi:hypothetical protein
VGARRKNDPTDDEARMSTKIYYGLRFPTSKLCERGFVEQLRHAMQDVFAADFLHNWKKIVEQVQSDNKTEKFWREQFAKAETDKQHMYYLLEWMSMENQNFARLYESTLVVYLTEEWTYGYVVAEHGVAIKILSKLCNLDNVEEYGYWDNTDRPKYLSQKEWRERRDNWEPFTSANDRVFITGVDPGDMVHLAMYAERVLEIGNYDPANRRE